MRTQAKNLSTPPAVRSQMGVKIIESCTIDRPAADLYRFWRRLENLPRFMKNLVSVTETSPVESHWIARVSARKTIEWDALIINEHPNELIAWKTVEECEFPHAGSVRFEPAPVGPATTVTVQMEYEPTAGPLEKLYAAITGKNPQHQVRENLERFKQLMETGSVKRD